jgi:hypothetical protein
MLTPVLQEMTSLKDELVVCTFRLRDARLCTSTTPRWRTATGSMCPRCGGKGVARVLFFTGKTIPCRGQTAPGDRKAMYVAFTPLGDSEDYKNFGRLRLAVAEPPRRQVARIAVHSCPQP